METATRKKRALVLGGGGSRGAYEIGVWQALREMDWQFDIVTGTSVGSINGAIFATGEFDVAVEVWKRLDNSMVFNVELDESVDMKTKTALVLKKIAGDMVKTGGGDGARPCVPVRHAGGERRLHRLRRGELRNGVSGDPGAHVARRSAGRRAVRQKRSDPFGRAGVLCAGGRQLCPHAG